MNALSAVLVGAVAVALPYYLVSTLVAWRFHRQNRPPAGEEEWPPVSILKPVAGADDASLENFASFCRQNYPRFEVVFAVADPEDPALGVLAELRRRFPEVALRWGVAGGNPGPNYKVGNLCWAVARAAHPTVVISDGDMRVPPDYLRRVVAELRREGCGLVTWLYRHPRVRGLPAALDALTLQTAFVPNVMLDHGFGGIAYAFGSTLGTTKETLARVGGLEPLLPYLADDYQLGHRIRRLGLEVRLCPGFLDHVSPVGDLGNYLRHQVRWAVTQRVCRPVGYTLSVLTHGVTAATLLLFAERFSPLSATLFLVTVTVRVGTCAFLDAAAVRSGAVLRYPWLVPVNDLLNTGIWAWSLVSRTVHWRHRRFHIRRGGKLEEVPATGGGS